MADNLENGIKIVQHITLSDGAAGATDIDPTGIDTAGFDGVLFIVNTGPIVSAAVTSIKAQQCDTVGGSYADLLGTSQTIAHTDDYETFYIDVLRPREQFVKCYVDRADQNATVVCTALLYKSKACPVTHGSGVAGEAHVSPAEGTA